MPCKIVFHRGVQRLKLLGRAMIGAFEMRSDIDHTSLQFKSADDVKKRSGPRANCWLVQVLIQLSRRLGSNKRKTAESLVHHFWRLAVDVWVKPFRLFETIRAKTRTNSTAAAVHANRDVCNIHSITAKWTDARVATSDK